MNFARDRFGLEPRGFTSDFVDASEVLQLSVPWSLYHYRVQGASVADWYLEEQGARLSRARRAWLAAQQASWLSIWEVIEVEVGATLTLRDLLSDERRFVEDFDVLSALPHELRNTDGDPLLLTTDHYRLSPAATPFVEKQLASLEGVQLPDPGEDPAVYVFLRPGNPQHPDWENTVIGQARLTDTALRLESNSRKRSDALRQMVEAACGDRIRHRAREHEDPLSSKAEPVQPDPEPVPSSPEERQLLLEFKERHYEDWLDQPLPALDEKTPRDAIRTAKGRASVDVLLKDMENHEQRSESGGAFDFSAIRHELGLE